MGIEYFIRRVCGNNGDTSFCDIYVAGCAERGQVVIVHSGMGVGAIINGQLQSMEKGDFEIFYEDDAPMFVQSIRSMAERDGFYFTLGAQTIMTGSYGEFEEVLSVLIGNEIIKVRNFLIGGRKPNAEKHKEEPVKMEPEIQPKQPQMEDMLWGTW